MDEDLYFSEYKMFTDYEIDEITRTRHSVQKRHAD